MVPACGDKQLREKKPLYLLAAGSTNCTAPRNDFFMFLYVYFLSFHANKSEAVSETTALWERSVR